MQSVGGDEKCIQNLSGNLNQRGNNNNLGVDGRIT
jgi:hypothetical protein